MQQHQICRPIVWQLLQQSYCPSHSGGHGDGWGDGHESDNGDSHGVVTGQGGSSNGGKEKVLPVQTYCLLGRCFSRAPLSKPFINHCLLLGQNIWLVAIAEKKITPQRIHSSARPMQIKPKKMQKFHFKAKLHFYMLAGFEVVACIKIFTNVQICVENPVADPKVLSKICVLCKADQICMEASLVLILQGFPLYPISTPTLTPPTLLDVGIVPIIFYRHHFSISIVSQQVDVR